MFIGIDVGLRGGVCFLENQNSYEVVPTPLFTKPNGKKWMDVFALEEFITKEDRHKKVKLALIEHQHVFPGQGAVSSASLMAQYHHIMGMFQIWQLNYQTPRPTEWKEYYDLVGGKKAREERKKASIAKAKSISNNDFKEKEKSKVDHDGMAEAYLIALYAKHIHENNNS